MLIAKVQENQGYYSTSQHSPYSNPDFPHFHCTLPLKVRSACVREGGVKVANASLNFQISVQFFFFAIGRLSSFLLFYWSSFSLVVS
jgi:hypothetical protein